jgi:thioredoxin-like negative regulator of GroEL
MKQLTRLLSFALLVLAVPASARMPDLADAWNGPEIGWRDMRTGVKESVATGKPALLVFHATWCQVCRHFRAVFKDPAIVAASRDLVMILVDIDKEPDVNGAFAPDGAYVPRTVFVNSEGQILHDLQSADPQYRYSADVDKPDELLSLMLRAAKAAPAKPAQLPAGNRGDL